MQSSSGFLMLLALYTFIALSNPTKKVIEPYFFLSGEKSIQYCEVISPQRRNSSFSLVSH
jgi:hypothetical protein